MSYRLTITKIDIKRFNAIVGRTRHPYAPDIFEELEWYSNYDDTILATILLDQIDGDFGAVLFGRDENGQFRAFEQECSMLTVEQARFWVIKKIKEFTYEGKTIFPQGTPSVKKLDIFNPVVSRDKQHPYFYTLNNSEIYIPAKNIINNIMPYFNDIDGNFIEQFQTTAFDSRLWELYIDVYLNEERFLVERVAPAPDFIAEKYGFKVAIEAVIVGRRDGGDYRIFDEEKLFKKIDVEEKTQNEMPIRYGSPLFTKLKKEYWKMEHVAGKPLIFAIADFHDDKSMLWSSTALINYLYGFNYRFKYDKQGNLVIIPEKISTHKLGDKEIPSGFFFQKDTENISAILFSSSGTISKFNRMGKQAGYSVPDVKMFRIGTSYNHDPNACKPSFFSYEVDERCSETWAEGMCLYHNPNAKYPVDKELFPTIAHHYLQEDGNILSFMPVFHPYASITINIKLK